MIIAVADLGGREGHAASPNPKFIHFHAVFGKNWPNNRLAPPPSGKSWIRHCIAMFSSETVTSIGNSSFDKIENIIGMDISLFEVV